MRAARSAYAGRKGGRERYVFAHDEADVLRLHRRRRRDRFGHERLRRNRHKNRRRRKCGNRRHLRKVRIRFVGNHRRKRP